MYARAYVRIWTLRSWYNNSTSQWRVKIETRPFYRKKIQILKNMAVKPRLPWYISRRLYEGPNKYYWGKVAEFGGHSLNGFEVIQLFSEGSSKALPPTPARELTNRRLSYDAAAGSRHSSALPSCGNLNLRFVVKTTTLVREAGKFSRRFWSLFSSFHK